MCVYTGGTAVTHVQMLLGVCASLRTSGGRYGQYCISGPVGQKWAMLCQLVQMNGPLLCIDGIAYTYLGGYAAMFLYMRTSLRTSGGAASATPFSIRTCGPGGPTVVHDAHKWFEPLSCCLKVMEGRACMWYAVLHMFLYMRESLRTSGGTASAVPHCWPCSAIFFCSSTSTHSQPCAHSSYAKCISSTCCFCCWHIDACILQADRFARAAVRTHALMRTYM